MKNSICLKITATTFCFILLISQAFAQHSVRRQDHFWRKRIVSRISFVEKINRPLVYHEANWYDDASQFTETEGLIVSLVNGVKQGKYLAWHPDDWQQGMNYDDLLSRMEEFEQALSGETGWGANDEFQELDAFEASEAKEDSGEEWQFEPDFEEINLEIPEVPVQPFEPEFANYEQVVHVVEDWIFDKNRGSMIQNIAFFEVIWVDPTGVLPEKVLARFKWKDVEEQLDQTLWKNRHNDAYGQSMKDCFVMRMYHGFMIDLSGEPVNSLWEAEKRRQEIVEFESHLWSH